MKSRSIVFTHGVFDLLHSNHIQMLKEARSFGTYLIVAVHTDLVVQSYKRQAVLDENERLAQVQAIRYVDEAFIDPSPMTAEAMEVQLNQFQVDHYVYCGEGFDDHFEPALRRGILHRLPYHDGINTTNIIEQIRSRFEKNTL